MSRPAIRVEGLWKEYAVGRSDFGSGTLYDLLSSTLRAPFQRFRRLAGHSAQEDRFWALKDVSFEIQPGEVVGIIGRNGAGKSTLLKVLSRITAPSRGRIEVRGRLASLLEVGTGFHPELSGRENIFLNGAILGMTRAEVARKFDEIVAFAEIEKFVDTPVKRYSSGMYVRLAFAVAAHLETDVLIVDEVLAVGDSEFQRKCLTKLGEYSGGGRTVLFVSHNLSAIRRLCGKTILLSAGEVQYLGETSDALERYLQPTDPSSIEARDFSTISRRGTQIARVVNLHFESGRGSSRVVEMYQPVKILLSIQTDSPQSLTSSNIWLLVRNAHGEDVVMFMQKDSSLALPASDSILAELSFDVPLPPGRYSIATGVLGRMGEIVDWVDDALDFEVESGIYGAGAFDGRLGLVSIKGGWSIKEINRDVQ